MIVYLTDGYKITNDLSAASMALLLQDGKKSFLAIRKGDGLTDEQSSEPFATRSKPGNPKWEKETTAYEQRLRSEYTVWAEQTSRELAKLDDDDEFNEYLDEAIIALVLLFVRLGREYLPRAHQLGLADVLSTPEGIQQLASVMSSNDELLENSLGPAIRDKVVARVQDDELIRGDVDSLKGVLTTFLGRVASYAGPFWGLIGWGFVDRLRQMMAKPRVRVVLDKRAKHCTQCPEYAGEYENIDAMMATTGGVPARWNSDCGCNCRCWIEYEKSPGVWTRM